MTRYAGWETLAIHLFTGALFLAVNGLVAVALVPARWPVAVGLLPLAAFSWWGWYAEWRYVTRVSRALRRG